ncbi:Polycystic kidney disease and receptor for egg jelly-related protein [Aphelenchoides besseyi]|nr:Polycystic kidney disease and receptor for egg jelly-related protein [Aphelenchoides besseyi]KAI6209174.1 Polycystic kidney disease and receptor for egg jelly-related protein [Aphelenchoides besseyi]
MSDPQPTSDSPTSPHPAAPPPSPHTPRNAKENAQKTELQPEKIVVALAQSPIVLTAVEQNDAIKPINSIPLHSISSHSNLSTSMLSSGRISYHVSSDSPSNRDTNIPISPLPMTETPQQTETLQPLLQPTPMDSKSPAMTTASTPTSQRTIEFASYSVVVRTGCAQDAGTYANVFIQLTDSDGNQTDKCRLKCSITHRRKFCRGHHDLFMLVDQNVLNDVRHVDVWHERKQAGASWLLTAIDVVEHARHRLFQFSCGKWFGREPENTITHMRLDLTIPAIQVFRKEDFSVYN